jgi:hypothetical protein
MSYGGYAYGQAPYGGGVPGGGDTEPTGVLDVDLAAPEVALSGSYTPPAITGSIAADLAAFEVAITGGYIAPIDGAFGATLGPLAVSIAGVFFASESSGSIDTVVPAVTVTLSGTYTPPPIVGSVAADLPAVDFAISGTLAGEGPTGSFAVTLATPEITLTGLYSGPIPGDTGNAAEGIIIDGTGTWTWTPAVVEPPTGPGPGGGVPGGGVGDIYGAQEVVAQAFPVPTLNGAHALLDVTYKREPRLRQRVVIHGQDVTYVSGYPAVIEQLSYREPFLYGSAVIRFPQLPSPFHETVQGANPWCVKGNTVVIESVNGDNEVVATDFKGRLSDFNLQGVDTVLIVAGEVTGPADTRWRPLPLVPYRHDAGRFIQRILNNLGVVARPHLGVDTGYILGEPGPGWMLEILDEMHAQAWTKAGRQWTTMPDANGIYQTFLKDNTTVHATAYPDGSRVQVDLSSSITDEHNRVYGRGVRKDGMVINNGVYGGMIQGDVPAFPGTMSEGDSGENVTVLIHRLRVCRYMNADEARGGFDADVVEAVQELQEDAGILPTGVVDNPTWRALWDLDVTGVSVRGAQIVPLAQRDYTREWNHTGGGAFTSRNPEHDPTRQIVDLEIDFGPHQRRNQMVRRSRAELADSGPHYTGTITLTEGALPAGDHTPGSPITTIIHDRELRPGMNIKLPTMLGDQLLHIAGIDRRGRETTLAVDTKFRDAVPVWKIHERNRENRQNLNRWSRGNRSSGIARDSIGEWSEVGGLNDRRRDLIPGEWIVFEVISGPTQGTIRDLEISCGSGVEYAVAVFGSFVNPAKINNWVSNPLTEAGRERWTDPDIRARLREHNILYAAGVEDDPCGYWPDKKSEGASIITGDWFDESSWTYSTAPRFDEAAIVDEDPPLNNFGKPVLYVCVYANANGYVRPGRLFKPQGESGV